MITRIRQDAWAKQNRITNAVEKKGAEKGKYLHPGGLGTSVESGIHTATANNAAPSHAN